MNKKNLFLAIVLLVLVSAAYIYQGPFQKWRQNRNKVANFLSVLNFDVVDKMEIKNGEQVVILKKKDDRWLVDGTKEFYVSVPQLAAVKDALKRAGEGEARLMSENIDKKKELKTDESGINLKLSTGDKILLDFIIGNRTADYNGSFVSELGSEKTYSVEADLIGVFSVDSWYDKTVFSIDQEKIKSVRFQYPDSKAFVIEKNDKGEWGGTQPYKFPVAKGKMDAILKAMSSLQASDIPKQEFAGTGLEKHNIIVQATGDGVDNTIMIGDKNKDGLYFAKTGESDNIYLISAVERDTLNKRISNFK